jgi:hypothetical protein
MKSLLSNVEMGGCCRMTTSFTKSWKTLVFLSMFVFWGAGFASAQVDPCVPSIDLSCPASVTVGCDDVANLELTGSPVFTVNTCFDNDGFELPVVVDFSDEVFPGTACAWTIVRTWIVSVPQAELSATCTQTISVNDNDAPVFNSTPENITVQCVEDVPAPGECPATDDCGSAVTTEVFTSHTGAPTSICSLTTPIGPGPDGSIWLFNALGSGLAASDNWSWIGSPSLTAFDDGTARLVGDVVNNANATQGWHVDMMFENKADWASWSSMGRSYKNDLGLAGTNYLNWDYYELVAGFSTMTGFGSYAGNVLYLSHQPSNYYFGFQCGVGANNRNANEGMSGWFYYNGWYNGQWRSGHGDMFTNKSCVPQNPSLVCDDEFTYLWRATDACGNASITSQVITVFDNIAPVISNCPENETVECSDELPAVFTGLVATDNCDDEVSIVYLGESAPTAGDNCTSAVVRTWYAEDDCGNRTFCEQTITIVDTTAPEFTFVPADATYECDEEIVYEEATANDNCHEVIISTEVYEMEGNCPNAYTIYRYFSVTDGCGNWSYATQVITVVDTTAPVFNEYTVYLAVECTEVESVPAPTATDNCSDVVVVVLESEILNSGGCLGTLERHYVATDACGNSTEAIQYISILDTTAPIINTPENATVECDNIPAMPAATGYDNCGYDVTVTGVESIIPGECENSYTIVWTWTAVDYCENVSTSETQITVIDTTNPVLSNVPADVTIECSDEVPAVVMPTGSDNCDDNVDVAVTEFSTPGECANESMITRIFRAFDNCGNEAIAVQYIAIVDTTAPVFTEVAPSVTVECSDVVPAAYATATDNCGAATVEVTESSEGNSCYTVITRNYVATDACGNMSYASQTITIVDTTAPVITGSIEINKPCDDFQGVFVEVSDNCNEWNITYSDEHVSGGCQGRIIRTYTAVDICQNQSTFVQIITLTDEVAPAVTFQSPDQTIECGSEYSTPVVEFADNCAEELTYASSVSSEGSCPEVITYTFSATDNCQNTTTVNVVYTIVDTTAPTVSAPNGGEFSCDQDIVYGEASAWDTCSEDLVYGFTDETIAGICPSAYTVVRTWSATDECGNTGYATSYYYVYDNTAPVFTEVAGEVTIECNTEIPAPFATAEDNCGEVIITVNVSEFAYECLTIINREYVATDACGNSSYAYQTVSIVDTTAPVITGTIEIDRPCDDYQGTYVTATDNCNTFNITYTEEFVSGGCQGRIIRDYTATDFCGNSSNFQQIITLTDATAPTVASQSADMTIECGTEYSAPVVEFTDNCDDELEYTSSVSSVGSCPEVVTYTFTATDNCENSTSVNVVYTIVDTTAPMVYAPNGGEFSCDSEIVYGQPEAWDTCSEDLVYGFTDETIAGECPNSYTVVRTWSATDECGNIGFASTSYYVYDTTAPVFTEVAQDVTIECNTEIPAAFASATDNCGDATVSVTESTEGNSCISVITRNYTATDACGNMSYATQTITIVDTTAPVIVGTIEIDRPCTDYVGEYITVTDNCNTWTVNYTDENVSGGCQGRVIRNYTATDLCGNSSTFQQIITLTDEVAPVAEVLPVDLTVECSDEVPGFTPSWSDNCDDELELSAISSIAQDGCTQYISRSWTAVDNCGNSTTISQMITIVDTTAPVWSSEGYTTTYSCDQEWSVSAPSATDNCNEVTVSEEVEVIAGNCPAAYTEIHTFVANDGCGNSSSPLVITVNVVDNTAPEWTYVPSSNEISCNALVPNESAIAQDACSEVTVGMTEEIIAGQCASSYIIVRTYTAIDACGNEAEPVSVSYYIYDNEAPVITTELSDLNYDCPVEIVPAEIAVTDNCSEITVTPSVSTIWSDECGNGLYLVSYYVVDACGNSTEANYTVSIYDETAPVLSETPADLVLDCGAALPEAPVVTAQDNCNDIVDVDYTETIVGEMPAEGSIADCDLITPVLPANNNCGYPVDWAMVMFGMPSAHRYYQISTGNLVQYPDGTVHVVATLVNAYNPANGFNVDVTFANGQDWASWSTQSFPTSFKADCGGEGANHEDWMYYILQGGEGAELVGFGDYAGSAINLFHAPSSNYFGFQLGDGANNYNGADNGFGGWFTYNGVFLVNGEPIFSGNASGGGDFAFELDCCPDYSVVRCWSAMDCTGNMVEHCQTISWLGSTTTSPVNFTTAETAVAEKGNIDIVAIYPNPTNNLSEVKIVSEINNQVVLDVMDATGRVVNKLYSGQIEAGQVYKFTLNTDAMNNGIYQVRLISFSEVATKQLQVIK